MVDSLSLIVYVCYTLLCFASLAFYGDFRYVQLKMEWERLYHSEASPRWHERTVRRVFAKHPDYRVVKMLSAFPLLLSIVGIAFWYLSLGSVFFAAPFLAILFSQVLMARASRAKEKQLTSLAQGRLPEKQKEQGVRGILVVQIFLLVMWIVLLVIWVG